MLVLGRRAGMVPRCRIVLVLWSDVEEPWRWGVKTADKRGWQEEALEFLCSYLLNYN